MNKNKSAGQDATARALESRSMVIAMVGSAGMGIAGLVAALLSNSAALMLDGLFSLVAFTSAYLGRRVSRTVANGPDRSRPLGYAADESIFTTLRSLSILGLILFATGSAVMSIYSYWSGGDVPSLTFGPIFIYFGFISIVSVGLWFTHHRNWIRTGKSSDVLRVEAKAAVFDGLLTGVAAAGLIAIYFFQDGFLAPVAPIGDSMIVLLLCVLSVGQFWKDFRSGLAELAGASATAETIKKVRDVAAPVFDASGGEAHDIGIMKLGRRHLVCVFHEPPGPIEAAEVDELTHQLKAGIEDQIGGSEVLLIITQGTRSDL